MPTDKQLNKSQEEAVKWGKGPLLVIAGAGTGKTTVITERIKHLILEKGVLPPEILALTFTEKAAQEMEERVDIAMPYGYTQMWISTFHSFGDRILKNDALDIGLDPRYRLITEAEGVRLMKKHLFEFDLSYFRPLGNPTKFLSGMFQHFSRLQDEDVSPNRYYDWAQNQKLKIKNENSPKQEISKWLELASAYKKYEEIKTKEGVMDFSDLIYNTLRLFRERPNVLAEYKKQFKYILVDEFQDTNIAQNELIKLLAGEEENLTVVADDDQSIYKWRGAAVSNVIQFRESYPQTKIITLTENYRSTQEILDASYHLIQNNNPDRLEVREKIDKKLISKRGVKGVKPEFIHVDRVENEAEQIATKIIQTVENENRAYSDFAILVRANNHSEPFARNLERAGIPYQFLGPGQLFRQPEIKEIFSYLKVLYNFEDSSAFYKILTMEHLNISPRDIAGLANYARKFNLSLFEASEKINDISVTQDTKDKIEKLILMIHKHLGFVPKTTAGQILYYFFEDSGLLRHIIKPANLQDEKKAKNIARFFDKLKTYETEHEDASVFAVVDWIELSLDLGESPLASDSDWARENAVNILTIHSAKGLEFPVVFMVNMVDQRFPTRERREQIPIPEELIKEVLPEGNYHLQEERRLAYVAITRAKDRLYFTAADYYGEGKREKKISLFVPETGGEEILKQKTKEEEQLSILDYASPKNSSSVLQPTAHSPQPVTHLSYSQIDCFGFCPLHYKLKYILKIPTPPSSAQSFGNSLHVTLKEFCELEKVDGPLGEKELLEIYERVWIPLGFTGKAHEEKIKQRGKIYLTEYLKTNLHNPQNPPLALEKPFIFSIAPGLKVGGKIDRIDKVENGIEIIDYKTTDLEVKGAPSEKELQKDLQLSIYALASCEVNDTIFLKDPEKVRLSLYFFNKSLKVSTTRTREQLEHARKQILKAKKDIEESDFDCSGNIWCKDCEYKLFCEPGH